MRRLRSHLDGTMLAARVAQVGRASFIKSIQRGSIAIATGAASNTATITAVDLNNTILIVPGQQTDSVADTWDKACVRTELTNSTTITANRTTIGEVQTVTYEVIEFWPGVIKQVQRGTIALTGVASATATITAVNTAKSTLMSFGFTVTELSIPNRILTRLTLTNATTVTADRSVGTNNVTIGYQVVEFY